VTLDRAGALDAFVRCSGAAIDALGRGGGALDALGRGGGALDALGRGSGAAIDALDRDNGAATDALGRGGGALDALNRGSGIGTLDRVGGTGFDKDLEGAKEETTRSSGGGCADKSIFLSCGILCLKLCILVLVNQEAGVVTS
jgi:hypothetical protein